MNIFEELNNKLEKLLEGEVISFAKAKALKDAEKAVSGASDEIIHLTV